MPILGNNDAILGIGFEFDEVAFNEKLEHFLGQIKVKFEGTTIKPPKMGKPSPADDPVEYAKKQTRSLDEITAERLKRELAAYNLTFKKLETEYHAHSKKVVDLSSQLYDQRVNHASKAEIAITANLLHEEKERTAILRKEYTSRDEVQRKGAGAFMGILGTGRNLISATGITAGSALAGGTIMAGIGLEAKKGVELAAAFELAMAHLGNEVGIEGPVIDKLGEKLRKTALQFNTELPDAITATETALRSLGPEFRNDASAMDSALGSILTLSKAQKITATESSDVLTTTLHQFELDTGSASNQAASMARIMNVLAAATKQGVANMPQLAEGMKASGIQAHTMGISLEQDAAAIEFLSKKGIDASEAGSKFALFLSKISGSTPEVEKGLKRIGLTYEDINPEKVGLNNSLKILSEHLNKVGNPINRMEVLTEVFGTGARGAAKIAEAIFGDVDALQKMTDKITGTTAAQDQANKVFQTAKEKYEHAKLALDETALSMGQKVIPVLSDLATLVNHSLSGWSSLIELMEKFGMKVGMMPKYVTSGDQEKYATGYDAISNYVKDQLKSGNFSRQQGFNALRQFIIGSHTDLGTPQFSDQDKARVTSEIDAMIGEVNKQTENKTKPDKDNNLGAPLSKKTLKQQFEARKAEIEDEMHQEITDSKLHGLELNKSKEQIEIDGLNIEIRYQKQIADAAEHYAQYSGEFYLKAAQNKVRIRELGIEDEKKIEEEVKKKEDIRFRFELSTEDTYGKQRMELRKHFWEEYNTLTDPEAIAQLTQMALKAEKDITDAQNNEKLKKENEFQAKILSVQMKGIEQQIKTHKKDSDLEVKLEDDRYVKALDQQKNYYSKAIIEAKADEKLLQLAKEENNIAERNLLIEHLENLKKISEEANKDVRDIFSSAASGAFSSWENEFFRPWDEEIAKSKDVAGGFVRDVAKGFLSLGTKEITKSLFDAIFNPKKPETGKPLPPDTPGEAKTADETKVAGEAKDISISDASVQVTNATFIVDGKSLGEGGSLIGGGEPDLIQQLGSGQGIGLGLGTGNGFRPFSEGSIEKPLSEYQKKVKKHYEKVQKYMDEHPDDKRSNFDQVDDEPTTLDVNKFNTRAAQQFLYTPLQGADKISNFISGGNGTNIMKGLEMLGAGKVDTGNEFLNKGADVGGSVGSLIVGGEAYAPALHQFGAFGKGLHLGHKALEGGEIAAGIAGYSAESSGEEQSSGDKKKDQKDATKEGMLDAAKILQGAAKGGKGKDVGGSLIGAGEAALNIAVPGLGSVLGALGGIFGFADGGDIPGTDTGRDSRLVKVRPQERILTPPQARDYDRTMDSMRRITENYDLHNLSRSSSYSGGSSVDLVPHLQKIIESNHAIGAVLDSQKMGISGGELRRLNTQSYADTIRKKFA